MTGRRQVIIRLQFLVNHYQEPPEIVRRLLESIAMQDAIIPNEDYNVLICNDGEERVLEAEFLNSFPFKIDYRIMPHRGVCATRNTLLDMATADYVMFCDADDCFSSPKGVSVLLRFADYGNVDAVSAPFDEEVKAKGSDKFVLRRIPKNLIWIHNKLFRRQFLLENDIRFPEEVKHAGDMTFVWHVFHASENTIHSPEGHYTWKYNEDSVTRKLPYAGTRFYGSEIRAYKVLTDKLISRGQEQLYQELIASLITTMYIRCKFIGWGLAPKEYVDDAKSMIKDYVQRYAQYYKSTSEDFRLQICNRIFTRKHTQEARITPCEILGWVDKVNE